jgi:uncharacterized protein
MRLAGGVDIAAPARDVWDFVLDPTRLASCIPGITDVRQADDHTFDGHLQAAVGPMHGQFEFRSVIERSTFPTDLVVGISGVDSITRSRVRIGVDAALEVRAAAVTRMEYVMSVNVEGRLAILGEMILRATAGAVIGQVTACMRSRLEGTGDEGSREAVGKGEQDEPAV